ncbi:transposase [Nitrosococcus wardiae]|uniref:Transposase n=2 Tax=Nitrosococcus wardiae TaxID=1814290 RepID=A0A4P7BY25_9GAMM|nr:transposase [Nitrosococcus wardiae]
MGLTVMPAPYSLDLRQKVIEAYRNKEGSIRQLATRFKLSKNTVSGFLRRFRETGTVHPKRREGVGHPAKIDEPRAQYLAEVLQREPDLTLQELCQRFEVRFGETISTSAMDRGLKKHRITRKKNVLRSQKAHAPGPTTLA